MRCITLLLTATLTLACAGPTASADPPTPPTEPTAATPEATEDEPEINPAMAAMMGADYSEAWAVILWGSPEKAPAEKWLADYAAAGGPTHGDYPKLVDSAEVALLKPGFWVIIGAEPETEAQANAIRDRYRTLGIGGVDTSGAYVREVRIGWPEYDLDTESVFATAK